MTPRKSKEPRLLSVGITSSTPGIDRDTLARVERLNRQGMPLILPSSQHGSAPGQSAALAFAEAAREAGRLAEIVRKMAAERRLLVRRGMTGDLLSAADAEKLERLVAQLELERTLERRIRPYRR